MADHDLLIGDIGGTNARFALADHDDLTYREEATLRCADYETAEEAVAAYLHHVGISETPAICLAVAGPVIGQSVRFTNSHWIIEGRELADRFAPARVRLMNDFEAAAYSVPLLAAADTVTIGLERKNLDGREEFTVGIIGPGTGLGVGGLLRRDGEHHAVVSEGGHVGFAPENQLQFEVLRQLRERFERVSDERLLCGPGLENIYWALRRIHGQRGGKVSAADIFERALSNQDVVASEALNLFYEALGQAAGNLALTLGAHDGVYIAGGIVKRYPDLLKTSAFRSGFENKGRYRSLMERIPTHLIVHPQPGLLGASFGARRLWGRGA